MHMLNLFVYLLGSIGKSVEGDLNRAIKQLKPRGNSHLNSASSLTSNHVFSKRSIIYNPGRCSTRVEPENHDIPIIEQYKSAMKEFL
ncbi:hypothetical protein EB796_016736 [Bugula neritina]|uniref:Uncharacterized protein n=1 Tax=Bugula neritina TaxID=10212 RepID=A0A7J7JGM4_BUGNE|nr:hypothetical protein EB796_022831 [Bugula neritina]KAF6024963.1 hypothetical protein EB796_016736 [Bugula neritina]